jgi:probable addiction module antidote protein
MAKRKRSAADAGRAREPDPASVAASPNAALEEVDNEEELFLLTLRAAAEARGMSRLAQETGLKRESLYRMLSAKGNPRLSSLGAVLRALRLRLAVGPRTA